MSNEKVTLLNKTWKPLLALVIILGVFLAYVIYPILYNIGYFIHFQPTIPKSIIEHLNALLIGGGTLATIRTFEKKINGLDKRLYENSFFEYILDTINKTWRPVLAIIIILSVFILYILIPIETMFIKDATETTLAPKDIYDKINDLLIMGGLLAGLKAYENSQDISHIH